MNALPTDDNDTDISSGQWQTIPPDITSITVSTADALILGYLPSDQLITFQYHGHKGYAASEAEDCYHGGLYSVHMAILTVSLL